MRLHLIDLSFESCWFVCHSLIINDEICYSQICLKMALVTPFLCPNIYVQFGSLFIRIDNNICNMLFLECVFLRKIVESRTK